MWLLFLIGRNEATYRERAGDVLGGSAADQTTREGALGPDLQRRFRFLDGRGAEKTRQVKDTLAFSGLIMHIAPDLAQNENWLPIVDTFRTLAVCPPPTIKAVFRQLQALANA